jgi:hypothetical protein
MSSRLALTPTGDLLVDQSGTGFYVNLVYGVEIYLVVAKAVNGLFAACLYVGESTAMLSYPVRPSPPSKPSARRPAR